MLVWSEEQGGILDEARIRSRWPKAGRIQKLGQNLFLVAGHESRTAARPSPAARRHRRAAESPRASAEAILAAARQTGARDKEATALTDLGMIHLSEGDPQGAIASLEKALAITRRDRRYRPRKRCRRQPGHGAVVGSPARACPRAFFEQDLAHARSHGDRFAEKVALERLGLASWSLRDFSGALGFFEQALSLTRQLGDRHQEANLLWHQGIQHAELGQREQAIAKAEEAVAVFRSLGRPQAASYGASLQKYRMGLVDEHPRSARR